MHIKKKLEKDLKNLYGKYMKKGGFDDSVPDKIREQHDENRKLYPQDKHPYPLIAYKIRNGKVSVKPGIIKEFTRLEEILDLNITLVF